MKNMMNKVSQNNNQSSPTPSISRWLLCLTALLGIFGFAGCSDAPVQQAAVVHDSKLTTETKPAVVEHQPSVDELLAQIAPPESCLNTLKNIRFALDMELFLRPEFYTPENVQRFFGASFIVDPKFSEVSRKTSIADPCISRFHFGFVDYKPWSDISKGPLKEMHIRVRTTSNIKDKPKFIKIDEILAQFTLKEPIRNRPRRNEDIFWVNRMYWDIRHHGTNFTSSMADSKRYIEKFDETPHPHPLGGVALNYMLNKKIEIQIVTYRDGSIAEIEIFINKE